jgi:hypothetical protein
MTYPSSDDLDSALARYKADVAAAIDQTAATHLTDQGQVANLSAQIADLQSQITYLKNPTLFGCTLGSLNFPALQPQIVRTYDSASGLLSRSLRAALPGGFPTTPVTASLHPRPGNATHLADFRANIGRLTHPEDRIVIWHEYDDNLVKNAISWPDLLSVWGTYRQAAADASYPGKFTLVLTGWDLRNRVSRWFPSQDLFDEVGIDPYSQAPQTAASLLEPLLDILSSRTSKPLAVTEVGCNYTGQDRVSFIDSLRWLRGHVSLISWFNSVAPESGRDYSIGSDPAAAAAWLALR